MPFVLLLARKWGGKKKTHGKGKAVDGIRWRNSLQLNKHLCLKLYAFIHKEVYLLFSLSISSRWLFYCAVLNYHCKGYMFIYKKLALEWWSLRQRGWLLPINISCSLKCCRGQMNEVMFSVADILYFMASLTTWPVLCEHFIKVQCIFYSPEVGWELRLDP